MKKYKTDERTARDFSSSKAVGDISKTCNTLRLKYFSEIGHFFDSSLDETLNLRKLNLSSSLGFFQR